MWILNRNDYWQSESDNKRINRNESNINDKHRFSKQRLATCNPMVAIDEIKICTQVHGHNDVQLHILVPQFISYNVINTINAVQIAHGDTAIYIIKHISIASPKDSQNIESKRN